MDSEQILRDRVFVHTRELSNVLPISGPWLAPAPPHHPAPPVGFRRLSSNRATLREENKRRLCGDERWHDMVHQHTGHNS